MSSEGPPPGHYDLSPPITDDLAVWPGDTPASRQVLRRLEDGGSVTLSTLHTTVHVGTHADAPSHTVAGGPSIDQVDPWRYVGPCQVMALDVGPRHRIGMDDLPDLVRRPRLLLRTGTFADPRRFDTDWAVPSPDLVVALADAGVVLLGTDAPSVDLFESTTLPTHHALAEHGIAVLEGLVLDGVPTGDHELIAPPLPLHDFDASPVRALLRPLPDR